MRQQKTTFITGRDGGRRAYKRDFTTTRASLIYLLLGFLKSTFMFTFIFANYQNSQPCTSPRNFTLDTKLFFCLFCILTNSLLRSRPDPRSLSSPLPQETSLKIEVTG